ncbi:LysR family transcriptional regulator [Aureimonas sp. AU22]|uniref:LysR family transcriptional regulator n=1 Tax=Aureimonas sp. AU22 TaxID=1638162 RepID=UPI000783495A|nr:LysR family transcriptional regulator [Aureimonas sp. AU22]
MPINDRPPSFDDLRVFLIVAKARGFRVAARTLGLSPSTISETVSRLETDLGVPLLARTTRSVVPTEAGEALAARLFPLFDEALAATRDVATSKDTVRGRLKLNVPGAVMRDILPPLVDRYLDRHPDVQVEIVVEDRLVDITAAGCDAGIRYGEHLEKDMIAVPIGPRHQEGAVAAAPAYLARHAAPEHPQDLLAHRCLRIRFSGAALGPWEFERGGETLLVDPPAHLVLGTAGAEALLHHAVAGRGIVYTFRNWLGPHLESGALVPLLQDWWPRYEGPRLYFSRRFMPSPLRAFVDLVREDPRTPRARDDHPVEDR